MTTKLIDIYAGHFQGGGSDKVWGGALIDRGPLSQVFLSCWGARGASLQNKVDSSPKAADNFAKKRKEKIADGYKPINPRDYGIMATLAVLLAEYERGWVKEVPVGDAPDSAQNGAVDAKMGGSSAPRVVVSHLTPMSRLELEASLTNPNVGLTEKVNGVRFPVEWTGTELIGYNRKGERQYTVPKGAELIGKQPYSMLIDGERLEGKWADHYVMFDILEYAGQSVRNQPYNDRIHLLSSLFYHPGFGGGVGSGGVGGIPPMAFIQQDGSRQLHLLYPVTEEGAKRSFLKFLEDDGREGVVTRTMSGISVAGNTTYERKFKFLCDLDAIVLGTNLGRGTASVRLGLVRPSDGKIISVGSVRSGLTDSDVNRIEARLNDFSRPVILVTKVGFLKARTVGTQLVEPTMYVRDMRTDKDWHECTTDQLLEIFGEERRAAIEDASPVTDWYAGALL